MATLAALLDRTDLRVLGSHTAKGSTDDHFIVVDCDVAGRGNLSAHYVVDVADGDMLIGRVLRDHARDYLTATAQLPDGRVVARGEVAECELALWQLHRGSLSPAARRAIERA